MLVGLIARSGTFVINAGLVFLLSQHAPQMDWWSQNPKAAVFEEYRNNILTGLARVRVDLQAHGNLLFQQKAAEETLSPGLAGRMEELDRRTLRQFHVTN